jgi:hypothetical protein
MSQSDKPALSPDQFPVSVILRQKQIRQGRWTVSGWELVGVVAGEAVAGGKIEKTPVRTDDDEEQFLWSGFVLQLYKDSAESYWYNLVGKTPSLFVMCRPGDDDEMVPFVVSANYDEAGAYMEADDTVFSAPMPPEVYQWLERYVVANYTPQEPYKRKRKRWVEQEAGDGKTSEQNERNRH